MVFTEDFFGAGRYRSIRHIWQINFTYAVVAIVIDLVTRTPGAAIGPNPAIVIGSMVVVLVNFAVGGFRIAGREMRIIRNAIVVLVVLIVHDNLVGIGMLPWTVQIEATGITLFIGCLGYALALRAFGNERRLATLDYELQTARRIQLSLLPSELPTSRGPDSPPATSR